MEWYYTVIFTVGDYLKYLELTEEENLNGFYEINEDSTEYNFVQRDVNNIHDKTFRKIIDNKIETVKFLKNHLKLKEKLTEGQIEKYNSSFLSSDLKNQEADVIYKMKDEDVFF